VCLLGRENVAEEDFLDIFRLDAGLFDGSLDGVRTQLRGRQGGEGAEGLLERCRVERGSGRTLGNRRWECGRQKQCRHRGKTL
jgi:hypothetical protein